MFILITSFHHLPWNLSLTARFPRAGRNFFQAHTQEHFKSLRLGTVARGDLYEPEYSWRRIWSTWSMRRDKLSLVARMRSLSRLELEWAAGVDACSYRLQGLELSPCAAANSNYASFFSKTSLNHFAPNMVRGLLEKYSRTIPGLEAPAKRFYSDKFYRASLKMLRLWTIGSSFYFLLNFFLFNIDPHLLGAQYIF